MIRNVDRARHAAAIILEGWQRASADGYPHTPIQEELGHARAEPSACPGDGRNADPG